jgi:surfeit locus 1 family protein
MTKELDFRRVVFSGEFDYAKQLLVGPRPPPPGSAPALAPSGHGYYLVTPCRLADGSSIFVNRGWVPVNVVQQSYFAELAPTLTGVLRLGEHRPVYESAARKEASDALQAGAVAQERYFFSDINATLVNLGQRSGPPVLVDVLEPAVAHGFPVRKEAKGFLTFNIMPTMHYVYAGTWFTLGTFIAILMRRRFRPHLFRALGNYYYPRPPRAQPPSPGPP